MTSEPRSESGTKARPPYLRYAREFGLAAICVAVAWVVRMALDRYWGDSVPYVTFYVAMVVIIWFTTPPVALASLFACLLLGDFFFTFPRHTIGLTSAGEWLNAGFFLLISVVLLAFVQKLKQHEAALAASQTRTEEALRELNQAHARTQLLAETASQLLLSTEPRYVINSLCLKVMAFLDCDLFLNFLLDEKSPNTLRLNACAGIPEPHARDFLSVDAGSTVSGSAVEKGCVVIVEDVLHATNPRAANLAKIGVQAYACHPLKVQDRILGTLSFGSGNRTQFQENELSLMKAVADLVAIALERQRSQAELQRMNVELEKRVV